MTHQVVTVYEQNVNMFQFFHQFMINLIYTCDMSNFADINE